MIIRGGSAGFGGNLGATCKVFRNAWNLRGGCANVGAKLAGDVVLPIDDPDSSKFGSVFAGNHGSEGGGFKPGTMNIVSPAIPSFPRSSERLS